jgi:broad specificity phosphatase PhoE
VKILFIRHAQTERNVSGLTHLQNDNIGLTEIGKEQAKKVAVVCQTNEVKAVFSSPELRARETAQFISDILGVVPSVVENFKERDWGDWSGLPWSEIKLKLDSMDGETRYSFIPPNGESWAQMSVRLRMGLDQIVNNDSNVAVVIHGGALRALLPLLNGTAKETSFEVNFENTSVTVFTYEDGQYYQEKINDTAHLR